jgi:flagellar hook-basal body complex protein FliE
VTVDALAALQASLLPPVQPPGPVQTAYRPGAGPGGFAQLLLDGVDAANAKLVEADAMVRAFALDDSIPVHQVTYALEQARLSFELMLQVRNRLLEGYQQLMNMQL